DEPFRPYHSHYAVLSNGFFFCRFSNDEVSTLRRDTVPHLAPCFRHVVGQTQLGLKAGQSEARYLFSLTCVQPERQKICCISHVK
ncbi:MAG: hypothetical protein Q3X42_05845, partial [Eggerthellaceae bacterium]|nr:hypothetical protein [Eggerthellaceae bacterium]